MESSRTKKAIKNVKYNLINQIFSLVLAFVSRTVFIHYLGITFLGMNSIFSDVLGILSLADLGFNTAMVYSYYQPLADNDTRMMQALTTIYRRVYHLIAGAILVIGIALTPFVHYIVRTKEEIPFLELYYLLALSNVVISYLCVYRMAILIADQKEYKITKIRMRVNFLRTIFQIVVIVAFQNYIAYLLVGCIGTWSNNLWATKCAERDYPYLKNCGRLDEAVAENVKTGIFHNLKSVFLYKISSVFINATDNLLISILLGTAIVGYYSNYLLIQNKLIAFYTILFTSVTASIGNLIVKEKEQKRYEIFCCEQALSFVVCAVVIPCYVLLVNDFIRLWLGNDYLFSVGTVAAIGLNMYLSCVLQPLWSYREATGMYRKTKYIMLLCAALNLFLSIVLGKWLGITGILFASAISRIATYFWYEPKLLFELFFSRPPFRYYRDILINVVAIGIIIGCGWAIGRRFTVDTWLGWGLKAIVLGCFCVVSTTFLYWRSEGVQIIKRKLPEHIRR